jgi:hypothetical protein
LRSNIFGPNTIGAVDSASCGNGGGDTFVLLLARFCHSIPQVVVLNNKIMHDHQIKKEIETVVTMCLDRKERGQSKGCPLLFDDDVDDDDDDDGLAEPTGESNVIHVSHFSSYSL